MDGTAVTFLTGINFRGRQQIVVGPNHLTALVGKSISELWFRRDANKPFALEAGTAALRVSLSDQTVSPDAVVPSFVSNRGSLPSVVFDGTITTPASPAVVTDPWALDQTVRIALTTEFPYSGGSLCIELESGASLGCAARWPVDAEQVALDGAVIAMGHHCSQALVGRSMLVANPDPLAIGTTIRFSGFGAPFTPAMLMIGTLIPNGGIDLGPLGMTGCALQVTPAATLSGMCTVRPASYSSDAPCATYFDLTVPFQPALLGGSFATQLVNLETGSQQSNPVGVTLSAALQVTLATSASTLGMTMIEGPVVDLADPLPSEGAVITNRAPVLRFVYH